MAAFNKFNVFHVDLGLKKHNLNTDTFKVALTNSQPQATNTVLANISQITSGTGYTTGGNPATVTSYSASGTGGKWVVQSLAPWTCTSGTLGPFKYAVLYNDSDANDALIGWWEYTGSAPTLNPGESFTLTFDTGTGILVIQ